VPGSTIVPPPCGPTSPKNANSLTERTGQVACSKPQASGSEDRVQGVAHQSVVCERPERGVTLEALPVRDRRTRPASGVAGAEPGLAFGVTPHCLLHAGSLLRSERALEAYDASGLEARSDIGRIHGPSLPMPLHRRHRVTAGTRECRQALMANGA
jgi:hypothetical protein